MFRLLPPTQITRYWLPTIRDQLGEEHNVPIVLVGNKVDLHEYSTLDTIVPIMNQYCEIETCVEVGIGFSLKQGFVRLHRL